MRLALLAQRPVECLRSRRLAVMTVNALVTMEINPSWNDFDRGNTVDCLIDLSWKYHRIFVQKKKKKSVTELLIHVLGGKKRGFSPSFNPNGASSAFIGLV